MRSMTVRDLTAALACDSRVLGRDDVEITHVQPLAASARPAGLSFCTRRGDVLSKIQSTSALIVICPDDLEYTAELYEGRTLVLVPNPRLAFARAVEALYPGQRAVGVHPSATVESSVELGDDVYVGPFTTIGEGCALGSGTAVFAHTTIYAGCRFGENVAVHSGCVVGAPGFGYERDEAGQPVHLPHIGGVRIGDGVVLHPMVHIARGTIGDTTIGERTKVDAFCHIAHNVGIGSDCLLTAHAEISGSVRLGDRVWVAPGARIREGVVIGDDVVVGMGAVVTRDVECGQTVMGAPARPRDQYVDQLRALSDLLAERRLQR